MGILSTLARALGTHPDLRSTESHLSGANEARLVSLETHVKALYDHARQLTSELQTLRQDETRRAAEHATMVDQLSRLYKRVSARISRSDEKPEADGESTLTLKRRLGR